MTPISERSGTLPPGTLPTPGPIGRTIRLFSGIILLVISAAVLISYSGYVKVGVPDGAWWFGAVVSIYLLPRVFDVGFGRSWGRWPQLVVLVVAVIAAVFDVLQYENLWGPPLGLLVYGLTVVVVGYFGVSFILAAILAVPGCEVRALPSLIARLSGRETAEHYCSTMSPLDEWEISRQDNARETQRE